MKYKSWYRGTMYVLDWRWSSSGFFICVCKKLLQKHKVHQLVWPRRTNVTDKRRDRRIDRRTTYVSNTALCDTCIARWLKTISYCHYAIANGLLTFFDNLLCSRYSHSFAAAFIFWSGLQVDDSSIYYRLLIQIMVHNTSYLPSILILK